MDRTVPCSIRIYSTESSVEFKKFTVAWFTIHINRWCGMPLCAALKCESYAAPPIDRVACYVYCEPGLCIVRQCVSLNHLPGYKLLSACPTMNLLRMLTIVCKFTDFQWSVLISSGLYWFPVVYTDFQLVVYTDLQWSILISSGLYWFPVVYTDLQWSILIYSGLYWFTVVYTDFQWSILISSGLYWMQIDKSC